MIFHPADTWRVDVPQTRFYGDMDRCVRHPLPWLCGGASRVQKDLTIRLVMAPRLRTPPAGSDGSVGWPVVEHLAVDDAGLFGSRVIVVAREWVVPERLDGHIVVAAGVSLFGELYSEGTVRKWSVTPLQAGRRVRISVTWPLGWKALLPDPPPPAVAIGEWQDQLLAALASSVGLGEWQRRLRVALACQVAEGKKEVLFHVDSICR